MPESPAAPRTTWARFGPAAAAAALAVWAGLWAVAPPGGSAPTPLSSDRAGLAAARAEAAFAGAQADWRAHVRAEFDRELAPATLRHFVRATSSPCAGAAPAAGPFYCAEDGVVAMDLATIDGISARLRRDSDLGLVLFVGRVVAAHVQAELGLEAGVTAEARSAQGDCLAGVWAGRARLGQAPSPALYGRLIEAADSALAASGATRGAWRDKAVFSRAALADREAAFGRGLAAGTVAACAASG